MINEKVFSQLKPIISDPAWGLVVSRIKKHLEYADTKIHQASKDNFEYWKGFYDSALFIYNLLDKPKNIADDGVKLVSPNEGKER